MLTMLIYVKFYVATFKPHFNHHDKYKINCFQIRKDALKARRNIKKILSGEKHVLKIEKETDSGDKKWKQLT